MISDSILNQDISIITNEMSFEKLEVLLSECDKQEYNFTFYSQVAYDAFHEAVKKQFNKLDNGRKNNTRRRRNF